MSKYIKMDDLRNAFCVCAECDECALYKKHENRLCEKFVFSKSLAEICCIIDALEEIAIDIEEKPIGGIING